jgi:succinoglycan biosynthesis protein ExoA
VNLAARLADPRCTVLLRADAHAAYPPGFVRCCVAELLRTGATSVVVPMRNVARADAPLQRAIAAAQSSRLGNGGSAHRIAATSRFVEHGHHAAFDRDFFLSLGGYDESFTHNEDAEFDHRQLMAGGRIWMCVDVPVTYFPRRALHSLARQYFQHGHGRARTLLKHRLPPRPRQMAPVVALGSVAGGLALAPVAPGVAVMALAYPALCLGWGAAQAVTRRDPWLLASGAALIAMHMGWANGFIRAVLRRRRPSAPRPRAASGSLPAGARAGDPPS